MVFETETNLKKLSKEYEFCDFLNTFPSNTLHSNHEYYIYIPKITYDIEVKCGQETTKKLRNQLKIDIPRSFVFLDGKRIHDIPDNIPTTLLRYCTQTVMAIPVEILSKFGIVAEDNFHRPLKIDIQRSQVCACKNLTVLNNDHCLPVEIEVTTDLNDSLVIVKIHAYSELDDSSFTMLNLNTQCDLCNHI